MSAKSEVEVLDLSCFCRHGRNWRKIVQEVGTRSVAQVSERGLIKGRHALEFGNAAMLAHDKEGQIMSFLQVRSHAQKYFLKLEKNGNTEEVPPARAKRPASKPYPIKNGTSEGRTQDAQGSLPPEGKRPRRTERPISKPLHTDFTLLEESPAISTDCDSIAFLLSEEGTALAPLCPDLIPQSRTIAPNVTHWQVTEQTM